MHDKNHHHHGILDLNIMPNYSIRNEKVRVHQSGWSKIGSLIYYCHQFLCCLCVNQVQIPLWSKSQGKEDGRMPEGTIFLMPVLLLNRVLTVAKPYVLERRFLGFVKVVIRHLKVCHVEHVLNLFCLVSMGLQRITKILLPQMNGICKKSFQSISGRF